MSDFARRMNRVKARNAICESSDLRSLSIVKAVLAAFILLPFAGYANGQERTKDTIEDRQARVAEQYRMLEQKLFTLFEYEKENNPSRAKLLKRAFILSQENGTVEGLERVVALMASSDLRDAEKNQSEVLKQLDGMLNLLQSEDRGKRIRDELQRHQEYLKEVERLLRIQKSLRGQADGSVDGQRLAKSQGEAAERAQKLADDIRENEEAVEEEPLGDDSQENSNPEPEKTDDQQGDSGNGPGEDSPADGQSADSPAPDDPSGAAKSEEPAQSGESEQGESEQGESGQGDASDKDQSPVPEQTPEANPVRERIAAAEDRMREAKEKLEQADREDAVEAMKEAEREIAAAKKELEEILRQLRGEEVERTLAKLEGRFRQMLERETKLWEQTKSLNKISAEQRQGDFEIKAGKLSVEQNSIATDAARALLLLREDGSSIAFPQTVSEMQQDMTQVASRLSAAKVGEMTIGIEEDIVETLNYLIEALVKEQKDREEKQQQQQPPENMRAMEPGEMPLVEQLAELRMLRGLQDRIYRRHTRYSKKLAEPSDMIGKANDPDMRAALDRLAEKQRQLTGIAREIVEGLNK